MYKLTLICSLFLMSGVYSNKSFFSTASPNFVLTFQDANGNTVTNPQVGGTYYLNVDYIGACGGVNPVYGITYTYGTNAQYHLKDATCGDTTFSRAITIGSSPWVVTVTPMATAPGGSGYAYYHEHAQHISNAGGPGADF